MCMEMGYGNELQNQPGQWYLSRGETSWCNGLPKLEGIKVFPLS